MALPPAQARNAEENRHAKGNNAVRQRPAVIRGRLREVRNPQPEDTPAAPRASQSRAKAFQAPSGSQRTPRLRFNTVYGLRPRAPHGILPASGWACPRRGRKA